MIAKSGETMRTTLHGVLRLRPGDEIECIDTEGLLHKVEITETGDPVRGLVRETESAHYEPPLSITLFQGLAKGIRWTGLCRRRLNLAQLR